MLFNSSKNLMTKEDIIMSYINDFDTSKERQAMLKGEKYYLGENDILTLHDETIQTRLSHNFMYTIIEEKVGYLLAKPITIESEPIYKKKVENLLGVNFQYYLVQLATEVSNKGIGYWYIYINEQGDFKYLLIPSEQCIPIWKDNSQEELEAMIRYYKKETFTGKSRSYVTHVEYYTKDYIDYYVIHDGKLILDSEKYFHTDDRYMHYAVNNIKKSFNKVPFIVFRNNKKSVPDLTLVKPLIDNYDKLRSETSDILNDCKNYVYILKNYGGEDLNEFLYNLKKYKAISVDEDGGVDALTPKIDNLAIKDHIEQLKRDIGQFGQAIDMHKDKFGNSPSGVALKFLYSGLDIKCNNFELEFKKSINELFYFINLYLNETGQTAFQEKFKIIFNRDIIINEAEAIEGCRNSLGIISTKTIVANHPWVEDLDKELEAIEQDTSIESYEEDFTNEPQTTSTSKEKTR